MNRLFAFPLVPPMTTQTARVIQQLEAAAPDRDAQCAALSAWPTDGTLREVLEATYDPFLRWLPPSWVSPPLGPIVFAEAADDALTHSWAAFREMLETTHRNKLQGELKHWLSSAAFPVFTRVLAKGFLGVPFDVANQWGTLPVFRSASIGRGLLPGSTVKWDVSAWTPVTVPLASVRMLVVVRDPFSGPVVDFFDEIGRPVLDVPASLREAVERTDFSVLEADGPYEDGIVFDGFVWERDTFRAVDIIPLALFKEQVHTAPFTLRQEDLRAFSERSDGGPFNVVPFLDDPTPQTKVLRLDPDAQYPYYPPSSSWTWTHNSLLQQGGS